MVQRETLIQALCPVEPSSGLQGYKSAISHDLRCTLRIEHRILFTGVMFAPQQRIQNRSIWENIVIVMSKPTKYPKFQVSVIEWAAVTHTKDQLNSHKWTQLNLTSQRDSDDRNLKISSPDTLQTTFSRMMK